MQNLDPQVVRRVAREFLTSRGLSLEDTDERENVEAEMQEGKENEEL
jgi:hypothetical protein